MIIKKLVAGIATLSIACTVIATSMSASAYTSKEVYNAEYTYSSTAEYMKWTFDGTFTGASTTASNSNGKTERYFQVSVGSYYTVNNVKLTSKTGSITTTNAGTGVGIQRDAKNQYIYFKHNAVCKTGEENLRSIADIEYRMYQTKN